MYEMGNRDCENTSVFTHSFLNVHSGFSVYIGVCALLSQGDRKKLFTINFNHSFAGFIFTKDRIKVGGCLVQKTGFNRCVHSG